MAITTYAAIHICSSDLIMKIFEISKAHGIVEVNHVRHKLSLGREIFANRQISYKSMSEICRILLDFKKIMKEYRVTAYHAYGTDALRESSNQLVVLDQIKLQANVNIRILGNSEERFLYYKAISMREKNFSEMIEERALIVDIGAGSVQLSLFQEGALAFTQNLKLGSSRINELLHTLKPEQFTYHELISEYLNKDLAAFCNMYLPDKKIHHIIAVGTKIPEIKYRLKELDRQFDGTISRKSFSKIKFSGNWGNEQSELIIPTLLLLRKIASLTKCDDIYMSTTDLCDSMAAEYAEKEKHIGANHDFTQDILATAQNIALRYGVDMKHVNTVSYFATEIFDSIRKLHGLGKRERLLLQIGVILHSCGAYINMRQTRENSYKIIMSTEIIGISRREQIIVANIVRYNSDYFPSYDEIEDELSREDYITVIKLCALLRLANVLDKSNSQKIKHVGVTLQESSLLITAYTMEDITLEIGLFRQKANMFEEVFGIRPSLKKRREKPLPTNK